MKTSVLSLAAAPALALAQTVHDVEVGNGGLQFSPDTVTAAEGDMINFHFFNPGSHSVSQSTYMSPCVQSGDDAIFSGYISMPPTGESPMVFQVTINSTDPLWLYCATNSHCQAGMAMVVNPPSEGMDLDTYKMNAMNTESSAPEDAQGGIFINEAPGSTTSSGAPSSSMTSSSMSSSSMAPGSSSSGAAAPTSSGAAAPSGGAGGEDGSPTSSSNPMETTGAASNLQVKGAAGVAALGLLGAMMV